MYFRSPFKIYPLKTTGTKHFIRYVTYLLLRLCRPKENVIHPGVDSHRAAQSAGEISLLFGKYRSRNNPYLTST